MALIGTPTAPQNQRTARREGSVRTSRVAASLSAPERQWTDNVLRVLKLPNKGSQARIIAGAIATAEVVGQRGGNEAQLANQLRDTVLVAGNPPWKDATRAMAATGAKVHLDLLSIPANNRALEPTDPTAQGVNASFWVNRTDADATTRASFLCKPASTASAVTGVPDGGEVIREAVAGHAAQDLMRQTGIDIKMPETHVIKLDSDFLPPNDRPQNHTSNLTCSVQEATENSGFLRGLGDLALVGVPADQVAALAIFDTMTLNTDRHSKNVMVDANNNLLPIDHGGCMVEPANNRFARVETALGGPHNALLKIPGAHQPLSKEMAKKLSAMESSTYGDNLRSDRDTIAGQHQDMAGLLSDDAIKAAQRSARFVKLAARNKPPLSPAAIQVALGGDARRLLDPRITDDQFETAAKAAIVRIASRQDVVKEVCLSGGPDFRMLVKEVEALGWIAMKRGEAPDPPPNNAITDPVLMLSLVSAGQRPGGNRVAELSQARDAAPGQNGLLATLCQVRRRSAEALIPMLDPGQRQAMRNRIASAGVLPAKDQPHDYAIALNSITSAVKQRQQTRLTTARNAKNIPVNDGEVIWVEKDWGDDDLVDAERHLLTIENRVTAGYYG